METLEDKVYDLMDWAAIEGIVYSEEDNPHSILGPKATEDGILIQTFQPQASKVWVKNSRTGKETEMFLEDEAGYYATLIPGKRIPKYVFVVENEAGERTEIGDPYAFESTIDAMNENRFLNGIHYDLYKKLGAHVREINGVKGTSFAVWAPNALRVSVVGSFNEWDGRVHQMRRLPESGIFELFIPGVEVGDLYKFEIKLHGDITFLKADPYANACELRPDTANIVTDLEQFDWTDETWMKDRAKRKMQELPMAVYEVHLGSWKKKELIDGDEDGFYNYRELAPMLAEYVKSMNYTHIELMPVMEHPLDESWGYQVTGYFAATSRYGTPEDLMYFMNYMHKEGIGVILDWVPAHFPKDTFGLSNFDGTCLYENPDPRRGSHPHWGTLIFDFGKPQVNNFLLTNALFWVEQFHADGIRIDAVASMLYLDYGRQDGEWLPNIYGGNENLEVVELLKQLNSVMKKKHAGVMMIAEESTAWPKITGDVEEDGLGFDFKWNMGWMNDFLEYMKLDPLFRKGNHNALTFSMIYQYTENFQLVLSHDEVTHGKGSMIQKMYGTYEQKFANLRAAYGFMMTHPGKKLLFMGQDFAQFDEWNEKESLQWSLVEDFEAHKKMQNYVKALNRLYLDYPALYEKDSDPEGFEWINCMDSERSVVSFLRKNGNEEDTLLVVCNFTPVVYEDFKIGVPFKGKYKETFNSDKEEFGGENHINPRLKQSKAEEWDEREQSISITVPPLGISVFRCTPLLEEKKTAKKTTRKTTKATDASDKTATTKTEKKKAKPEERKTRAKKVSLKETEEKKAEKEAVKAEKEALEAAKTEKKKAKPEERKTRAKKVSLKEVEERKAKKGTDSKEKITKITVSVEENKVQETAEVKEEAKAAEKVSEAVTKESVKTEEKEQDKIIEIKVTNTSETELKADVVEEKAKVKETNNTQKTTSKRNAKKTTATKKVKKPRPSKRARK